MYLLAVFSTSWRGPMAVAAIHGLKIVAVAVVAQALWGMARALTPDLRRAAIALVAMAMMFAVAASLAQIAAILFGALAGLVLCQGVPAISRGHLPFAISRPAAGAAIAVFALLLLGLPLLAHATGNHALAVFDAFYRAGALVFGGGHVVLPLLRDAIVTPNWIAPGTFLSGYGAAQALPGPLFTVSVYLGAAMSLPPNGIAGAGLALAAIFLPGMLVLCGALPFWNDLRADRRAQAAMRGINAAVVGLLAAALYDPLWTGAITNGRDIALALGGFLLLTFLRLPSLFVVIAITGSALLLV
jgi:chromate transporter